MCNVIKKMLIVDDDEITLAVEQAIFSKEFNVTIAKNGAEALELLKVENEFDVVLTDINMPIMDGVSLAREIRLLPSKCKNIFIIGTTACSDEKLLEEAKNAGINNLLIKPVIKKEVLDLIYVI